MIVVEIKNLPHNFCFRRHDLEFFLLVDDVAVGRSAEPFAVRLPPPNDILHLFAGIGDGHLVDEKLELNFQPVIVVGEVDVVPDGDDPHAGVPQILQFYQAPAVPSGESGKVLHHQNVILVANQTLSHGLIAFPLLKGIAGAVPIFVECQGAFRESLINIILNNGFLVFNGHIVPIQFIIHGDSAVAGYVKMFNHGAPPV